MAKVTFVFIAFLLLLPFSASAVVLTRDTVWQGSVVVAEDVVIPEGITLTIRPGADIRLAAAESTKTDPEYMSPLTEITVRGVLKAEGTAASPVRFSTTAMGNVGIWAGIIVDGGVAYLKSCRINHAETAVYVVAGTLRLDDCDLAKNRYGLVIAGGTGAATVANSRITGNDYGLFAAAGVRLDRPGTIVQGNRKKDFHLFAASAAETGREDKVHREQPVAREYADQVLLGENVWQGRIVVKGTIRLPEGSRLVIMPGTVVEFGKKDTNGDGIGENGLLIQGRIIAKGTRELPIVFRSAEKNRARGDWDAVNIMNSDGAQNLIEYCRIEDAYRGLHFHFSNVSVHKTLIWHNYRGIQFQESTVELKGNDISANGSGVQGRDSQVVFADNRVSGNFQGINFLRTTLIARRNSIVGNVREGMRIREGASTLEENLIDGNRFGLMVADTFYGSFNRNVISNNDETGFSMKNTDNLEVSGNSIAGNGFNGLHLQDARAAIKGNQITGNGERGVGIISFNGELSGNNLAGNGLYAVDLEGAADVAAPRNWWGGGDIASVVYDKGAESRRGKVRYDEPSAKPFPFAWPLKTIVTDAAWYGAIAVNSGIDVTKGATLTIMPGTTVAFGDGCGLAVRGRLLARGETGREIVFTSRGKQDASAWGELLLEYAGDSVIAHAVFEYATWGIHSHFTNLSLTDSRFSRNFGGMRFRSGPVLISRSTFTDNAIGIRAYRGNGRITENSVTGNGVGIFVREKGAGLTITANDIFANSDYNVRVGDFNDEDVNARGNWWGTADPADTIFDGRREPGIGVVIYEPYLTAPARQQQGR